jgi:hypothetical protein
MEKIIIIIVILIIFFLSINNKQNIAFTESFNPMSKTINSNILSPNENNVIVSNKQVNDYTSLFVKENSPFWRYNQPSDHTPVKYTPFSVEFELPHIPYVPHRVRPAGYHPIH